MSSQSATPVTMENNEISVADLKSASPVAAAETSVTEVPADEPEVMKRDLDEAENAGELEESKMPKMDETNVPDVSNSNESVSNEINEESNCSQKDYKAEEESVTASAEEDVVVEENDQVSTFDETETVEMTAVPSMEVENSSAEVEVTEKSAEVEVTEKSVDETEVVMENAAPATPKEENNNEDPVVEQNAVEAAATDIEETMKIEVEEKVAGEVSSVETAEEIA